MQVTSNSQAFIEAEQYSSFILNNLHDGLLPQTFYRNVSDFGSGTTLHIKTVGSVTIQEAAEDTPLVYNPIESGEVSLQITNYIGDAWYVTDDLREDGSQIEIAEKHMLWLKFTVTGKQCHASMPQMGVNSLHAAAALWRSNSLD